MRKALILLSIIAFTSCSNKKWCFIKRTELLQIYELGYNQGALNAIRTHSDSTGVAFNSIHFNDSVYFCRFVYSIK